MRTSPLNSRCLVLVALSCIASLGTFCAGVFSQRAFSERIVIANASAESFRKGGANGKISPELSAKLVESALIEADFVAGIKQLGKGGMIGSALCFACSVGLGFCCLSIRNRDG